MKSEKRTFCVLRPSISPGRHFPPVDIVRKAASSAGRHRPQGGIVRRAASSTGWHRPQGGIVRRPAERYRKLNGIGMPPAPGEGDDDDPLPPLSEVLILLSGSSCCIKRFFWLSKYLCLLACLPVFLSAMAKKSAMDFDLLSNASNASNRPHQCGSAHDQVDHCKWCKRKWGNHIHNKLGTVSVQSSMRPTLGGGGGAWGVGSPFPPSPVAPLHIYTSCLGCQGVGCGG